MFNAALIIAEVKIKIEDVKIVLNGRVYNVDGDTVAYGSDRDDFEAFEFDRPAITVMQREDTLDEIEFYSLSSADQGETLRQVILYLNGKHSPIPEALEAEIQS